MKEARQSLVPKGKGKDAEAHAGLKANSFETIPPLPKVVECAFIKWGMRVFACAHEPYSWAHFNLIR
jgi:hypothetical protein